MADCGLSDTFSRLLNSKKRSRVSNSEDMEGPPVKRVASIARASLSSLAAEESTQPSQRLKVLMAFARRLRGSRTEDTNSSKRSIVERLPPELYMPSARDLKPSEAVFLSLTCKSLWARAKDSLYRLKRCAPLEDTMHFLQTLEKENNKYVICTGRMHHHYRLKDEQTAFV